MTVSTILAGKGREVVSVEQQEASAMPPPSQSTAGDWAGSFLQPRPTSVWPGLFLSVEMRACRRKVLLTAPGFNEPAGE
jgi:hypothetical protein